MRILTRVCLLSAASARLRRPDEALPSVPVPDKLLCDAPVRRAPVDFPAAMTRGFAPPIDFPMESGYINVTADDYLFYWYMGYSGPSPDDAPVLIWSNGGPGCSAMEGATTEGGAAWLYDAKQSGKTGFAGELTRNPYAWNQQAHLVFVDQPRYVGYSTGTGKKVTSSKAAGVDMVAFLLGWRATFPEHAHRKLILASESYGGHYVPAWAGAVLDHNALVETAAEKLPVAGLMIGNGIVNGSFQGGSFAAYAKAQQLIPQDATPAGDSAARRLVRQSLGYSPNFYDYRLRDIECCGCTSYDYKEWSDWFLQPEVKAALHVCGDAGKEAFGGCAAGCVDLPGFDDFDRFSYSGALSRALQAGWNVTFYYGKQDTACNYVGALDMANSSLAWGGASTWSATPFQPLKIGGATVGEVRAAADARTAARLTFMAVDGAGHMVPMDNGAAASLALASLV